MLTTLLSICFAGVAFLYASVGHAGASGYIAILALAGFDSATIKPLALILNIAVAGMACWNFVRAGHLPWRTIWPVYLLAIPASFFGGWLNLPGIWFQRTVGIVLVFSAIRLGASVSEPESLKQPSALLLVFSGAALGLLAGLTGTGGGIFLTPLLLLAGWCTTRQAAATSVVFILINSIFGFLGFSLTRAAAVSSLLKPSLLVWIAAVLVGGWLGSRLGSRHWPVAWIRRILSLVLFLASLKLLGLQG